MTVISQRPPVASLQSGPEPARVERKPAKAQEPVPETPCTDTADCSQRASAEFSGKDPSCSFPDTCGSQGIDSDPAPGQGNSVSPSEASSGQEGSRLIEELTKRNNENKRMGHVVEDVGDGLGDRIAALQDLDDASRQEAVAAAGRQAGLSEDTLKLAASFYGQMPDARRAETASYLEHLFQSRGAELGDQRIQDLLSKLGKISDTHYPDVVGPKTGQKVALGGPELALSALHDLAAPSDIDQGANSYTCSANVLQMDLAQNKPERYLEMVDTLALGQTFDGIAPDPSFADEGFTPSSFKDYQDQALVDTARSLTAKLVQNAIMEYANGSEDYDSAYKSSLTTEQATAQAAAEESWLTDTVPHVMGEKRDYTMLHVPTEQDEYRDNAKVKTLSAEAIIDAIKAYRPSQETPLLMGFNNGNGHAGLIIGIEGDQVTYLDPAEGFTKTVSLEDLSKRIYSVQIPTDNIPQEG